ncbi:hypothetical protein D3C73_932560 [compost metagenome]
MIQEVVFPFFARHDIAAFRSGKRFMRHQLQNPPFGFPVPHQNDFVPAFTRLLVQRIDHNGPILEFQSGQQPVPYPVQIEPGLQLRLHNPVSD